MRVAKLIGYEQCDFTGADGITVKCKKLYIGLPLSGQNGAGMRVITLFATDKKIGENLQLPVGQDVYVDYSWDNRRKKYRFHGISTK